MASYIQSLKNQDGDNAYPVTVADAVYLQETQSDGTIKQQTLTAKIAEMESSFQDGVDTIVAKLTSLGITPDATTPAGIAAAIEKMYADRLEQGHKDVIADPGTYGLITEDEYNAYGETRYDDGVAYADGRVNTSSASYSSGITYGKSHAYAYASCSVPYSETYDSTGSAVRSNGQGSASATLQNGRLSVNLSVTYGAIELTNHNTTYDTTKTASGSSGVS